GQKDAAEQTFAALNADDWQTAERIVHTLKGVSGNIGANTVQKCAEGAEMAIRERRPRADVDVQLAALVGPLKHLISQLEVVVPAEQERQPVPVDPAAVKRVWDRLQALLAEDDTAAGALLSQHADLLNSAYPNQFGELESLIRACDFEAALAVVRRC
ncbi:MAG: Hpt domain-containing protein, partial [Myxococcales bacterium]|nr:Hpt domain-containing protein [Myxococcales bacterium]